MSKTNLDSSLQSKTELENQVFELKQRIRELEARAKESESHEGIVKRFELALWATNSAIWDWDLKTGEFWSSSGQQLLFGRGDEELTEQFDIEDEDNPWAMHLHPEDRERVLERVRDHLENDAPYDVEYRYRLPDGEYIWIRSLGQAVRAPDGRALRMIGSNSAIASQKRAETESARFREAVNNASEGFVFYDADERFEFANKRYRQMYPEVEHLMRPGESRKKIRAAYVAAGTMPDADGRSTEFIEEFKRLQKSPGTFELQLANGTWIKYSDHVLPDGGIVSVRTDITDIKRRETYYQALFESDTIGVTITRADGSYVATNSVYQRMLGYSAEELKTMRWQDVSHADEIDRIAADVHDMRTGTGSGLIFEKRFVPKQGGTVWGRLNLALINDGSSEALQIALVENISERVEAEHALRDSELRFRTIFEDAAIGIARMSVDGTVLQCNPAWSDMLGYGRGELDGKHWSVITYKEDIAENKRQSDRLLRGEITSFQMEKRFLRKEGGVMWGRLTVSLVGENIEHARFRIAMIEDITERKMAEDALHKSEAKFRQLAEGSIAGVHIHRNFQTIVANQAYADIFGFGSPEEISALGNVRSLIAPHEQERLLRYQKMRAIGGEAPHQYEYEGRRKDGTPIWLESHVATVDWEGEPATQTTLIDITERKMAESALRESEQNLSGLMNNIADSVATIDESGTILSFNRAAERAFGYRAAEVIGGRVETLMPEPHASQHHRYLSSYLKGGNSAILGKGPRELEGKRKDGSTFPMELAISEMRIGERYIFIGAIRDITERIRTEGALRESEQKLRRVFESAAIGISTNDLAGHYIETNATYQNLLGLSEDELRGKTFRDFTHPDDIEVEERAFDELLAGRMDSYQVDKRYIHKDGSPIWVNLNVALLKDAAGAIIGSLAIVEDITDRKRIEDELRISEARLAESQRIAGLGNWVWDIATNDLSWSDELYRIFGREPREFIASYPKFIAAIHPEDQTQVEEAVRQTLEEGEPYGVDHRVVWPDGSIHAVYERGEVFFDAAGKPVRMSGTAQDITARKEIEEQLLQAQKMEAVGQLTGGVAHDFNNLLAVMMGNLELIGARVEADGAVGEMVGRGVKAAERGAALTHRLLAFSRKQTLLPTSIDLNQLVAGMSDMLRRTLGETINIETGGAEDLWLCVADQPQLENALLNLAINARDAMPQGGRLKIETANISLGDELTAAQVDVEPGDYVTLTVSDTGSGIDEDTLTHVFEPFFTTKDVGKGSGLGLSMVYGFAKQSGGSAAISSILGEGSTVILYLPVLQAEADAIAESQSHSEAPQSHGERILVVEDDEEVRALAVSLLSDLGYETVEANCAQTALDLMAHTGAIDLVLSDVVLPGAMNGPDMVAEIQRDIPAIRIVYMTGYAEEAFDHHGKLDERTHIIHKPFRKFDFACAVRLALDETQKPA